MSSFLQQELELLSQAVHRRSEATRKPERYNLRLLQSAEVQNQFAPRVSAETIQSTIVCSVKKLGTIIDFTAAGCDESLIAAERKRSSKSPENAKL